MARVRSCAILFLDSSRKTKIAEIADYKGISIDDAAVMYTIGALKNAKRRGTARNYSEALDALEAEQVGDRGCRITRTVSADNTARTISRINQINAGDGKMLDGIRYVHDYDTVVVLQGVQYPTPHYTVVNDRSKPVSGRPLGKVLGSLYTEWEDKADKLDPELIMMDADVKAQYLQVKDNLRRFFAEYESRLGETSKTRLHEIAKSTVDPNYLTSVAGYNDPTTKREAKGARRLYDNFDHKDSISCKQFIGLVRQYV
jgi:hypothetical protein